MTPTRVPSQRETDLPVDVAAVADYQDKNGLGRGIHLVENPVVPHPHAENGALTGKPFDARWIWVGAQVSDPSVDAG